jgi:hypothetical protein
MKKLNNSLFKKFEPNKINNLAKIVGGQSMDTNWIASNGSSGCDFFASEVDYPCQDTKIEGYTIDGKSHTGDMYNVPC